MGRLERQEYVLLLFAARWDVATVRRLHELRVWRDVRSEQIPEQFRTKPAAPPESQE